MLTDVSEELIASKVAMMLDVVKSSEPSPNIYVAISQKTAIFMLVAVRN
jgi:hypothetical protein